MPKRMSALLEFCFAFYLSLGASLIPMVSASASVPSSDAALSGTVFMPNGTMPAPQAIISLHDLEGVYQAGSTSDSQGAYTIDVTTAGDYFVQVGFDATSPASTAYAAGGWWNPTGLVTSWQQAYPVTLTPGTELTLDLVTVPGGSIQGQAYSTDGVSPIRYYSVFAQASDGNRVAEARVQAPSGSAAYRLDHLRPDSYILGFWADPIANPSTLGSWYANGHVVGRQEQATPVVVQAGRATTGVDATMQKGGSINGRVFLPDGVNGAADAVVSLTMFGTTNSYYLAVDSTGHYTSILFPGTYYASVPYVPSSLPNVVGGWYTAAGLVTDQENLVALNVGAGQGQTLDLTLRAAGSIGGNLLRPGGQPVGAGSLRVAAFSEPVAEPWQDVRMLMAPTALDGTFRISQLPPDDYYLYVELPSQLYADYPDLRGGWYASGSVTQNHLAAQPVPIAGGQTITDLDITLLDAGSIAGRLLRADGLTPVQTFTVTVYSRATPDGAPAGREVRQVGISAEDGDYLIPSLDPGEYWLYFEPDRGAPSYELYVKEGWYADGVGVSEVALATPITVSSAALTGKDVVLADGGLVRGRLYLGDDETPLVRRTDPITVRAVAADGRADVQVAVSEVTGRFAFYGLTPGEYLLLANSDPNGHYSTRYYGDAVTTAGAERLQVVAGQTLDEIDVVLDELSPRGFVPITLGN